MSTNLKPSRTKVVYEVAGAQIAARNESYNYEGIPLIFGLEISGLKSRESLQPKIDALWGNFLEQVLNLISDSSSRETIGQQASTPKDTPTGQKDTGVNPASEKKCRLSGCNSFRYPGGDKCLYHTAWP